MNKVEGAEQNSQTVAVGSGGVGESLSAALGRNVNSGDHAEPWTGGANEALMRIPVSVKIVLGTARMSIQKLMSVTRGAVIPLDRKVGDLVDIVVNDRLVARGEVVVLDDSGGSFGISVREVARPGDT